MKKLLFALGLFLGGIIGFVGWSIAVVQKTQPGSNSTVFGCFHGIDWLVLAIYAALSLVGLLLAIRTATKPDCAQ